MTAPRNEAELRHWLVDYLVTTIGCSPDDIDLDASLNNLGVGSRDAVVLSGELSELVGRPVSPVEFWEHPTITLLARFLAGTGDHTEREDSADSVRGPLDESIAVIGIGCRFPGGIGGPEEYWRFLNDGGSAVGTVPADRWLPFDDGSPEVAAAMRRTTRFGAFLEDIDAFDAEYFDISPSEADKMDPQQRLLLEVANEALEHAGIPAQSLRHSLTGVFAGSCVGEYAYLATSDLSQVDAWSGTGGALSIIANRVSYFFDLRGPSVTIDTACSSSLVAIHLACQSLRTGDSNLALAAGVNLLLSPAVTRSFDRADAMSPTGQCHAFDAAADGFVRGEGCGVVVLKRLGDALADGDRVLGVIRGSAVNQDGRSNGLMAPNPAAQMAVLRAAYASAGIEPRDVDFVEAHGTGTLLGDPIEARALGVVLGRGRTADAPLLIGAVKSNLGHLEAAAGVAGFIKAVLSVHHGRIPANLGFLEPNPHIPFDKLCLKVVAEHTDWPELDRARRAGVSSFGFGGTNAHVVIEQAPVTTQAAPRAQTPKPVNTLVLSGKSADRVASMAGALADWLEGDGADVAISDVAHTLNHHRGRQPKFATVVAAERDQTVIGLRALANGFPAPGVVGVHEGVCRPGMVFVYSGQGSQWAGMGRKLLADEPAFAAAVAEIEPDFVEQTGFSLLGVLQSGESVVGIDRIQPVLVGVQLALTQLWRSYGVIPDAVIGHSMGEVAAAVASGALSVADGLRVIATRSRLMSALSGQGAMALIELDPAAAEELIAGYPDVTIAVYASPRQTVIAGPPDQVDAAVAAVAKRDRLARRVEVDVASHHPIIDPVLPQLRIELAGLSPRRPTIPVFTTTAESGEPRFDAEYWVANLRNPVRFSQAVTDAGAEHGTFVEVSPHPVLTFAIDDTLADVHHHSIPTLLRDTDDTLTFHTNLNATHTVQPPVGDHAAEPHPVLPSTPWHHTRHWVELRERARVAASAPDDGTLLGEHIGVATTPPTHVWRATLSPQARPYPGSHRIDGLEVVPVSVLAQTISTAAAHAGVPELHDVRFEYPIAVDRPRVIQVVVDGDAVTVSSSPVADAPEHRWVRHAGARLGAAQNKPAATPPPTENVVAAGGQTRSAAELLEAWGIEGQPFEWSVPALRYAQDGMVADVVLPDPSAVALLDAAVHVARLVDDSDPRLLVPASAQSIALADLPAGTTATVRIRKHAAAGGDLVVDVLATASDGTTCADVRGLRFTDVEGGSAAGAGRAADPRSVAHEIAWLPWSDTTDATADRGTLAVVGGGPAAEALCAGLASAGFVTAGVGEARCVVYVAGSGSGEPESDIDAAARMSADVADLVRTLAGRDRQHPATLWLITSGVREAAKDDALAQSSLWGMAAVIAAEQPDLWGGLVDLPAGGGDLHLGALAAVLPSAPRSILALRDGEFSSPAVVPLSGEPVREALRCRPDAAYLVTGGMGALGLLIAGWLADRGARRLVLAGRTALPPRRDWDDPALPAGTRAKVGAIRALEARGVALDVVALDVGSIDDVRALLARRDRDGAPPIRGVVHAAGVTGNKLLTDTTAATLREVMWPKIAGAHALHEAFPVGELDFFHMTATAGSVFGVPGQGAYAAANAYLDCLARARHLAGSRSLSLDWVAWNGLGFASDATVVVQELRRMGSRPVEPDEAFAAWEFVDRHDIAQAVMVPIPSGGAPAGQPSDDGAPARDWTRMSGDEALRELESGLRHILARELRIPESELEVDRPFAELGLNSVMAMSIRRDAEQLVGVELSATMLWNHPTITSLAAYLAEKVAPDVSDVDEKQPVVPTDSSDGVLDSLFDSVESSAAGAESGI